MNEILQTKLEMRLQVQYEQLRDRFAMAVLQFLDRDLYELGEWDAVAKDCYDCADAMMKARKLSANSCLEPNCDSSAISGSDFCGAHQLAVGVPK